MLLEKALEFFRFLLCPWKFHRQNKASPLETPQNHVIHLTNLKA